MSQHGSPPRYQLPRSPSISPPGGGQADDEFDPPSPNRRVVHMVVAARDWEDGPQDVDVPGEDIDQIAVAHVQDLIEDDDNGMQQILEIGGNPAPASPINFVPRADSPNEGVFEFQPFEVDMGPVEPVAHNGAREVLPPQPPIADDEAAEEEGEQVAVAVMAPAVRLDLEAAAPAVVEVEVEAPVAQVVPVARVAPVVPVAPVAPVAPAAPPAVLDVPRQEVIIAVQPASPAQPPAVAGPSSPAAIGRVQEEEVVNIEESDDDVVFTGVVVRKSGNKKKKSKGASESSSVSQSTSPTALPRNESPHQPPLGDLVKQVLDHPDFKNVLGGLDTRAAFAAKCTVDAYISPMLATLQQSLIPIISQAVRDEVSAQLNPQPPPIGFNLFADLGQLNPNLPGTSASGDPGAILENNILNNTTDEDGEKEENEVIEDEDVTIDVEGFENNEPAVKKSRPE